MRSRFLSLRESFLVGAPLVIVVLAGSFLSKRQSERLAEQHRIESGPLRLNVWSIRSMPVTVLDKKAGYKFSIRFDARVEGQLNSNGASSAGRAWVLRTKSAQVLVGKTRRLSRIVNTVSPYNPAVVPHGNILSIDDFPAPGRNLTTWVMCDAPPSNAELNIELEAVSSNAKTLKSFGPHVVAPPARLHLRPFDFDNDSQNNWKSEDY